MLCTSFTNIFTYLLVQVLVTTARYLFLNVLSTIQKLKPVLLVSEPRSLLLQSGGTGDHLDGGRMLLLGFEESGINLAGDNSGRLHRDVQLCDVLCCWSVLYTDGQAHSVDTPNGPVHLPTFMHNTIYSQVSQHFINCIAAIKFRQLLGCAILPSRSIRLDIHNWLLFIKWMSTYTPQLKILQSVMFN